LQQVQMAVAPAGVAPVHLLQALTVQIGMGVVAVAHEESVARQAKVRTDRLNMQLMPKARSDWDVRHLASPVTGGGIMLDRIEQLFLLARAQGLPEAQWPSFVLDLLLAQGQAIRKEGRALGAEEMRAEIARDCANFCAGRLPMLVALMVA